MRPQSCGETAGSAGSAGPVKTRKEERVQKTDIFLNLILFKVFLKYKTDQTPLNIFALIDPMNIKEPTAVFQFYFQTTE